MAEFRGRSCVCSRKWVQKCRFFLQRPMAISCSLREKKCLLVLFMSSPWYCSVQHRPARSGVALLKNPGDHILPSCNVYKMCQERAKTFTPSTDNGLLPHYLFPPGQVDSCSVRCSSCCQVGAEQPVICSRTFPGLHLYLTDPSRLLLSVCSLLFLQG